MPLFWNFPFFNFFHKLQILIIIIFLFSWLVASDWPTSDLIARWIDQPNLWRVASWLANLARLEVSSLPFAMSASQVSGELRPCQVGEWLARACLRSVAGHCYGQRSTEEEEGKEKIKGKK